MKRILRYAIGYVAMLTGMVLGLFGIGLSVVGLAFWQMQRASIASGSPDATLVGYGVLTVVVGTVLFCSAWVALK